ncbi:AAA family ATPase [Cohnella fermenti]|uniref:YhaN AAA domain-containing protein n=1 Tax=Cohnella fermenti TaxID=2565925 RepID=A0A4S4C668_9BACL|nr:AAA family ATPase [Cohnella fermenti]THF83350.1 hypothetical protein E6C55_05740 [Cohnella fermenti]
MRIKELQIEGFAALSGEIVPLDAPLTVVAGPNEAGKSTIHRFIRSLLYGFANRGQPAERAEPVRGGRHGGRLVLTDGEKEWQLERYGDAPNRRGGPVVTLRDEEGRESLLTQAELERLWLGGVSEKLFRQLFAVTLDELHELRTLQGEEVGNYLYHAGIAGGASLTSAIKTVSAELDKLYKPKGELPELNRLLAALKEEEAELRQSRKGIGPYNEAVMELEEADRELRAAEGRLPDLRQEAAVARGAANARAEWLRSEALRLEEAELAQELPDPQAEPLPEFAAVKWEALVAGREADRERLNAAAEERSRLHTARRLLSWSEELVRRLPELEALEARRETVAARKEERGELAADIRLLDESLVSMLGRLSPEWEEAELQTFASLPERERARQLLSALEEAESRLEQTEGELRRLERQQQELLEEEEAEQDGAQAQRLAVRGPAPGGPELLPLGKEALLSAWNELEDARRRWERAAWELRLATGPSETSDDASGNEPELGRRGRKSVSGRMTVSGAHLTALLAALLAIAAIVLPLASGMPAGEAAGYYVLAACLAVFALWNARPRAGKAPAGRSDSPELGRRLAEAREAARDSERRLAEAAAKLFAGQERLASRLVSDAAGDAFWRQTRDAVQERIQRLEREEREREAHLDRERERDLRRSALRRERERLEREAGDGRSRSEAARNGWLAWLRERRLSAALPPELLPELFQLAEQALQALRQRTRAQERAAQLRAGEEAFAAEAARLFAACPPPAAAGGDALLAVKLLHADALRQMGIAAEAGRLDERLQTAASAFEAAGAAAATSEAAVRGALDAAGEADEAAYERRLRVDERRRLLRRERREAELRLAAGRDASALAELQERLSRADEAALAQELAHAEQALGDAERQRAELLERRGRLAQQLERLRAEAETDDRVVSIEEKRAELDRLAERYAVLALCGELIRRTKTVFEEDKQPLVLHRASRYFEILTAGAYVRIIAPGDSAVLFAETVDRKPIDSSFLSRGTREQLYLALRFALAGATSPEQELPLLLDDLFVHFDESRLRQAATVLSEVSAERQVILFTCHEHTARVMAESVPGAALVRLPARAAALAGAGYPSP